MQNTLKTKPNRNKYNTYAINIRKASNKQKKHTVDFKTEQICDTKKNVQRY